MRTEGLHPHIGQNFLREYPRTSAIFSPKRLADNNGLENRREDETYLHWRTRIWRNRTNAMGKSIIRFLEEKRGEGLPSQEIEKFARERIITHRALEPFNQEYVWGESTYEGFSDQLLRGFGGLEFDPVLTKDGVVVWHDATLERATGGKDKRAFVDITMEEATKIPLAGRGRIATFQEVLDLIKESNSKMNSLHLKSRLQTEEALGRIVEVLDKNQEVFDKLIVFDIKPETAIKLKKKFPNLRLAPSVAHPYDIARYNEAVGGTLWTLEEALEFRKKGLIDGVWGDEWDRTGPNGSTKELYTKDFFQKVHDSGMFAALVTPELHGTSPHLLGGESHPDAKDTPTLFSSINEIINRGADYVCTDHTVEVTKLIARTQGENSAPSSS